MGNYLPKPGSFSSNEAQYISDFGGNLKVQDMNNAKTLYDFGQIHEEGIVHLISSPDKKILITADTNPSIKIWDIEYGKNLLLKNLENIFEFEINSLAVNNKFIFVSGDSGYLKQYNIETQNLVKDYKKVHYHDITSIAVNKFYFFTMDSEGNQKQWVLATGELQFSYDNIVEKSYAILAKGRYLYTACNKTGDIKKWRVEDYCELIDNEDMCLRLEYEKNCVIKEIFNYEMFANDKYLITAEKYGRVYQWNLVDCEFIKMIDDGSEYCVDKHIAGNNVYMFKSDYTTQEKFEIESGDFIPAFKYENEEAIAKIIIV